MHCIKRFQLIPACIVTLLWALPVDVAAQVREASSIFPVAQRSCHCGRWTCPACQQQMLCPPCPPGQANQLQQPWMQPGVTAEPGTPGMDALRQPSPSDTAPEADFGALDQSPAVPPITPDTANLFAANLAATSGGFGSSLLGATTPEMMGDFFGPGGVPSIFFRPDESVLTAPVPLPSYYLGRMKLAENNSPIPRDRIFFNYSLFTGVPLQAQPVTVNRFSPGIEKTFLDQLMSLELRVPMGVSIDNDIRADGMSSDNEFQFGNMFVAAKAVLLQRSNWLLTGGSSVLIPTAPDARVIDPSTGEVFLQYENESVHLMPFLGGAIIPRRHNRWFAQWMVQVDVDASGTPVFLVDGSQTTQIGRLQDYTLLYSDISIGYWLYHSHHPADCIRAIAPLFEVHYNRALNDGDTVSDDNNTIMQTLPHFDNVNIQCGLVFNLRNSNRLGIGYATPLGNSTDRVFDNEFRVTLNHYY